MQIGSSTSAAITGSQSKIDETKKILDMIEAKMAFTNESR